MICSSSLQQQGGLCYPKCNTGYNGVGPVCWADIPHSWVNCGMGAATTNEVCKSIIYEQLVSVGTLAFNIATFGASGEAAALEKDAALGPDFISQLNGKFSDLIALYNKSEDFVKFLKDAAKVASTEAIAKDIMNILETAHP